MSRQQRGGPTAFPAADAWRRRRQRKREQRRRRLLLHPPPRGVVQKEPAHGHGVTQGLLGCHHLPHEHNPAEDHHNVLRLPNNL